MGEVSEFEPVTWRYTERHANGLAVFYFVHLSYTGFSAAAHDGRLTDLGNHASLEDACEACRRHRDAIPGYAGAVNVDGDGREVA